MGGVHVLSQVAYTFLITHSRVIVDEGISLLEAVPYGKSGKQNDVNDNNCNGDNNVGVIGSGNSDDNDHNNHVSNNSS